MRKRKSNLSHKSFKVEASDKQTILDHNAKNSQKKSSRKKQQGSQVLHLEQVFTDAERALLGSLNDDEVEDLLSDLEEMLDEDGKVKEPNSVEDFLMHAEEAKDSKEAIKWLRKALEVGEQEFKKENADGIDYLWGIHEARPFMHAIYELATLSWAVGDREESLQRYRQLIKLNRFAANAV